MSFKSILAHIGEDIVKVFQFADKAATLAEPFVAIANPALGAILNTTLMAVSQAEALGQAAAAGKDSSAQKLAAVIAAIKPTVSATLVSLGVPADKVDNAMLQAYVSAFVTLLNTIPAPANTTVAPTPVIVPPAIPPSVPAS